MSDDSVLHVRDLRVRYQRGRQVTNAVCGVDLDVRAGESLGLIGESGSGKSSLGKAILGLIPSEYREVCIFGTSICGLSRGEWMGVRRRAQMVFQDVGGALSPRMRICNAVAEPLVVHGIAGNKGQCDKAVSGLLRDVGLDDSIVQRFPHELSGGQRQRVLIARALALSPEFLVADEPIASLDVSIQTQILALIDSVRRARRLTLMFITHDIRAVRALCSRVAVMYAGRIVEQGPTDLVLSMPAHPYTRLLLDSVPSLDPDSTRTQTVADSAPSHDSGCSFRNRCPRASTLCEREMPPVFRLDANREVRCYFPLTQERERDLAGNSA